MSIIAQITAPAQIISQKASQTHCTFSQSKTQVDISKEIIAQNFAPLKNAGILNQKNGWIVISQTIQTIKPSTILLAIIVHIIGFWKDHFVIEAIDGSIFGFEENHIKQSSQNIPPRVVQNKILLAKLFIINFFN